MDCCHDVCHTESISRRQKRTLLQVLAINASLFLVVLLAALYAGSSALLSGSIDNLGDAVTYGISFYAATRGDLVKAKAALFKGCLIFLAASAVTAQVVYKLFNPSVPIYEVMGVMTLVALAANFTCLMLLSKHRSEDINMASVWECSRNDVIENLAVLAAAGGVWLTADQWPDTLIAIALVFILYRSSFRIIRSSLRGIAAGRADRVSVEELPRR